jgi:hypothetical protein
MSVESRQGQTGGQELHCYTDESGNTGNNLFDPQQPYFWTATLVGKDTLSSAASVAVDALRLQLGVREIHAADIRMVGVDQVADGLRALLVGEECRVIFTRINKRFHARLKLADTVLDSGTNHAVSNVHYGVRGLRLPLAHAIVECMTHQDEEDFWLAYQDRDVELFRTVLGRIRATMDEVLVYQRTRELLFDAIDWAIQYPDGMLVAAGHYDSPNVVALSMILAGLHQLVDGTPLRVLRFVHDEQSQFARSLRHTLELGRSFQAAMEPTSLITDITRVDHIPADIEFVESTNEAVLQVVDVILWMTKRAVQNNDVLLPACERLSQEVATRAMAMDFTRGALARTVSETWNGFMSVPLSDEQLRTGQDLVREFEAARVARMARPPEGSS